jgi:hypothetical protein
MYLREQRNNHGGFMVSKKSTVVKSSAAPQPAQAPAVTPHKIAKGQFYADKDKRRLGRVVKVVSCDPVFGQLDTVHVVNVETERETRIRADTLLQCFKKVKNPLIKGDK